MHAVISTALLLASGSVPDSYPLMGSGLMPVAVSVNRLLAVSTHGPN